jgi:enoyl-CoA hydratase/carnithine racemase
MNGLDADAAPLARGQQEARSAGATMSTPFVEVADEGPVRTITMTGSPRRGNPMSAGLARALLQALDAAMADDGVKCIVLAGTPTHFCVGADLGEVSRMRAIDAVLAGWLDELDAIRRSRKPIVAAVRGHAVGGGFELALYCDLIVAADDARFALPETGIGVVAGQGGTQRLAGLAGRAIAADLILTGRELSGREAGAHGIAARVVPCDAVLRTAVDVALAIAARSAPAVAFAREVMREATEGHLQQSLRIERLLAALVLDTPQAHERIGAFLQRQR